MTAPTLLDHLVLATPDLDATVAEVEAATGVRAEVGGVHPTMGTRNSLVSLGGEAYLEIIAVDPDNPRETHPFGLDGLTERRITTWAAHPASLAEAADRVRGVGLDVGPGRDGARRTESGDLLEWTLTMPLAAEPTGIVPFLIDWRGSTSPAVTTGARLELVAFTAAHPDPDAVRPALAALGTDLVVGRADRAALHAEFVGPGGRFRI
ncbi:VOC family protein [Mariniluteicoccus flavus]